MAATDQTYRNQYSLDVVFAVSSILMLVSVVLMFMQDYFRPYKEEQRAFRDVESAVAQRLALTNMPDKQEFDDAEREVNVIMKYMKDRKINEKVAEWREKIKQNQPDLERSEADFQTVKQNYDSKLSFVNLAKDPTEREHYQKQRGGLDDLAKELAVVKKARDDYDEKNKIYQGEIEKLDTLPSSEREMLKVKATSLTDAVGNWKKLDDRFETQVKLALNKRWTVFDTIREFPIIDGFASPVKIQQLTITEVPIDYNFVHVRRFDRCMTCHLGIERPSYSKEMLTSLSKLTPEEERNLKIAKKRLAEIRKKLTAASPNDVKTLPDESQLTLTKVSLSPSRVKEFAAHPRLELFVGSNSKHPSEKFGCTSCHQGQGAGTTFTGAFHSPNTSDEHKKWHEEFGYGNDEHTFLWDFPMLPTRFVESSCLKCHHQVTDLYSPNNRNEAPKLLKGYNLIRENGCFGCHEIQGRKGGRQVGPDLRLEHVPPLDELTPLERKKIESDPDTAPGNYRKVGPSLYRLAEKTNKEWALKWLRSPRGFRPDTKMPHFYGLANNDPKYLATMEKGKEQVSFPDAEMQAIAHYLFEKSGAYLKELDDVHFVKDGKVDEAKLQEDLAKNQKELDDLLNRPKLSDMEKHRLAELRRIVQMQKSPVLVDLTAGLKDHKDNADLGRRLFSERGCLACHSHKGTEVDGSGSKELGTFAPKIVSEAQFGPNLSQIKAKLVRSPGSPDDEKSARTWLIQWIMDPHVHSPRSRMPVTHLQVQEAAHIANWLLSEGEGVKDLGSEWDHIVVSDPPMEKFRDLAKVYLKRLLPEDVMNKMVKGDKIDPFVKKNLPVDEQFLAENFDGNLKTYLGKKAVGRMGCFGCHDIPGFDAAKPIGVGLMDWGKKDPTKLAFEDIAGYVEKHFVMVPSLTEKGKPIAPMAGDKHVYEKFFGESLLNHGRIGYLNQKLYQPRSYDFNRDYAWDDRSRMPQFQFARTRQHKGESDEDYHARANLEEAEARQAVMTFILGLVAEPVPIKAINVPSGDRLAEVKGRQVIDKYNCAGCHLIRPGVFDFKLTREKFKIERGDSEKVMSIAEMLDESQAVSQRPEFHNFPKNYNWAGKNPEFPDRLSAQGVYNFNFFWKKDADPKVVDNIQSIKLAHALRYPSPAKSELLDIPAPSRIEIPLKNMLYPPRAAFASEESLRTFLHEGGPLGGDFARLLMLYLTKRGPATVFAPIPAEDVSQENSNALAASPPSLIGQGERTQTAWLYQFLRDPYKIRQSAVLRMPRFNMSPAEAEDLAHYFAAVARMQNVATEIDYPTQVIPQHVDLDSKYWKDKTRQYVEHLKKTTDASGKTLYDKRKAELQPFFDGDFSGKLKASAKRHEDAKQSLVTAKDQLTKTLKDLDKANTDLNAEKDEKKKQDLTAAKDKLVKARSDLEISLPRLQGEVDKARDNEEGWKTFAADVPKGDAKTQEAAWAEKYAYVADSYKLATKICLECHQVGKLPTANVFAGPRLAEVHKRIRPEWAEMWIAAPQRFLTYTSVMPINFPANAPKGDKQQWMAGSPLEHVVGVRDLLMDFPRLEPLPINRYWALSMPEEKPEEKKPEKK